MATTSISAHISRGAVAVEVTTMIGSNGDSDFILLVLEWEGGGMSFYFNNMEQVRALANEILDGVQAGKTYLCEGV
jgi:hypothetical protein